MKILDTKSALVVSEDIFNWPNITITGHSYASLPGKHLKLQEVSVVWDEPL